MNPKAILRDIVHVLTGKPRKKPGEFNKRIKSRHKRFWSVDDAEVVRNTIMQASDPIEQWKDVTHWQRKLSNKYNAREFARKHGCQVAELYWSGREVRQIPFDTLPEYYVIRPTIGHSSGLVFLMNNGVNIMDGKTYSNEAIIGILEEALAGNIHLQFLVEEFLKNEAGEHCIPNDFKMYLFNGELAGIQVINRFGPSKGLTNFYDEHWNPIDNFNIYYPKGEVQAPPRCIDAIVADGKRLSKAYEIFVRIDFYATDHGAVFGEFTPTPFFGNHFTPEGEQMLVQYWDRYCTGKI